MSEVLELLDLVVQKQAVTRKPGPMSTGGGFGSTAPINLAALELRDRLGSARGGEYLDLEAEAWNMIERPARSPLGACVCGEQVHAEFDRVSAQCPACGEWLHRADSLAAAREYVEGTWLSPVEIQRETAAWGTPVRAGRVRTWRWRGWITPDEHGRYLLADVLGLIDHQAAQVA